jgi:hypothetical protein
MHPFATLGRRDRMHGGRHDRTCLREVKCSCRQPSVRVCFHVKLISYVDCASQAFHRLRFAQSSRH